MSKDSHCPLFRAGMTPAPQLAPWLVFAGALLILQFRPIHDVDIFWQVRLGELMLQRGGFVTEEPFSAAHLGERLPPLAWLSQVIYALVHRLGGWPLLHRFDAIIWACGFLAVGCGVRREEAGEASVAAALALGFMAALPFASLRPQSGAVLCFGLLLALARCRLTLTAKAVLGLPLLLAWQNLHPSVVIAGLALGGAAIAGWLRRLWSGGAPPWSETILAVLTAPAALLTPAGVELFRIAAANADMSRRLGVGEWMPLWAPVNYPASATAWLALAATAWLLFRFGRRARAEDLGAGLVLAVLAILSYRFVLFWAVAMVPVWARCLGLSEREGRAEAVIWRGGRAAALVMAALALAVLVPILACPPLFIDYLPRAGAARLRECCGSGLIYNYPGWGGVLLEAGYPDWQVAYDGRFYRYSAVEWQAQQDAAAGRVPLAEITRRWHPVAFFLRPDADAALIDLIRADGSWKEIYSDDNCVAFVQWGSTRTRGRVIKRRASAKIRGFGPENA